MREEFRRLRGYDLLPFLPVLTGRVVDSPEISERFLRDLRQTVSDLLAENYIGRLRELAHADGLRLSMEAYTHSGERPGRGQPRRRADLRVLVARGRRLLLVGQGDGLGGARQRPADRRGRGVHGRLAGNAGSPIPPRSRRWATARSATG